MLQKQNINRTIVCITLVLALLLSSLLPQVSHAAAGIDYDWQGWPTIDDTTADHKNPVKMIKFGTAGADRITVERFVTGPDGYYENKINDVIDGMNGLKFLFTMRAGMQQFDPVKFRNDNMPYIKIYDEEGKNVIAEYGGNIPLEFYEDECHKKDEEYPEGAIALGTPPGALKSGKYTLVLGPEICGNNSLKKLGVPVKFSFELKCVPELEEIIRTAEAFYQDVTAKENAEDQLGRKIFDDTDGKEGPAGKYPLSAANKLAEAIEAAQTNTGDAAVAAQTLYTALDDFKKTVVVKIESIEISNLDETLQVGSTGTATADVMVEPNDKQYQGVEWSVSPEGGCLTIDKKGNWTANHPGKATVKATSTKGTYRQESAAKDVVVEADAQNMLAVNVSASNTLESIVHKIQSNKDKITALKIYTSKGVTLGNEDFQYIKGLPQLTNLNLFYADCGDVDFQGNTKLKKIVLPKTLEKIGALAFAGCENLEDIELPPQLTDIGSGAFKGCGKLPERLVVWSAVPPTYIPETTKNLTASFEGTKVKQIQVPFRCEKDYRQKRGWGKFEIIPAKERHLELNNVATGKLEAAVKAAGAVESKIDTLVISMANGNRLTRNEDIKWLQNNCLQATKIDLSRAPMEDDYKVKANYFKGRKALKEISLYWATTNIGDSAFADCENLQKIILPAGLTKIGKNAFQNCNSLPSSLVVNASEPPEYSGSIFNPDVVKSFIVPPQSVATYQKATGWSQFKIASQINLSLSAKTMNLEVAKSQTLRANVTVYSNNNKRVNWSSSNSRIAAVDKNGKVTGIRPGTAVIKATTVEGLVSASCTVTVKNVAAPKAKAASYGYNKTKVTWTGISGASGYEIYRSTKKTSGYTKIRTLSSSTRSYVDTGRTTGTTYYYKVRAYKTINGSRYLGDYSALVGAKPALSRVAGVKARRGGSKKIKVTWKKVSGASGYTVYRSTNKRKSYKAVKNVNSRTVKYTTGKLTKGKRYYFKVRAYRKIGKKKVYSPYSTVVSYKAK